MQRKGKILKRIIGIINRVISVVLIACMLIAGISTVFAVPEAVGFAAYADGDYSEAGGWAAAGSTRSLSEEVAMGVYGPGMDADMSEGAAAQPPADSDRFAEALSQHYTPLPGTFRLKASSRLYIADPRLASGQLDDQTKSLVETARLAGSQFAAYSLPSGEPLPVAYGDEENSRAGDIVIKLHPGFLLSSTDQESTIQASSNQVSSDQVSSSNPAASVAAQAYRLTVTERAVVEAATPDGVYYGLLTLLEIANEYAQENKENRQESGHVEPIIIGGFEIEDWPDLAERAIFLDCGRKYFSKEWIKSLIRRSSMQRYNALILHFSEAEGLRLDSRVFPWLTENIKSLSQADLREIVETAQKWHMKVIPSFDQPGHNEYIVRKYARYVKTHPDFSFTYNGKTYNKKTKGFGRIANHYSHNGENYNITNIGIDITKPNAVAFLAALTDDYADMFYELGCRDFDIGGDEILGWNILTVGGDQVNFSNRWSFIEHWARYAKKKLKIKKGSANDAFISYLNATAARLANRGYRVRVFNDDINISKKQHIRLDDSIGLAYWYSAIHGPAHYAKEGHTVYNAMEEWTYYVVRENKGTDIMKNKYKTVNARNIFENWDPREFAKKQKHPVPEGTLGGGYFCIWCDHPSYKTAATILQETEMKTWANAAKMWNPEVSTASSGTGIRLNYKDMRRFAVNMRRED